MERYLRSILHHAGRQRIQEWNPLVVLDAGNGTSAVREGILLSVLAQCVKAE